MQAQTSYPAGTRIGNALVACRRADYPAVLGGGKLPRGRALANWIGHHRRGNCGSCGNRPVTASRSSW
jgi:hypothetical protein